MPVDVWIERISFRETRHNVQAVLAYRLIFALLHNDSADGRQLALLTPRESELVQPAPVTNNVERQLSQR